MSIDEALIRYIASRDQQRGESADAVFNALTRREQELVKEAAVMGYVQGVRAVPGGHRQTIPPDADIVRNVISHCRSFEDLYPLLGGDLRDVVRWLIRRVSKAGWVVARTAVVEAAVELTRATPEAAGEAIDGWIADEVVEETPAGLRVAS